MFRKTIFFSRSSGKEVANMLRKRGTEYLMNVIK